MTDFWIGTLVGSGAVIYSVVVAVLLQNNIRPSLVVPAALLWPLFFVLCFLFQNNQTFNRFVFDWRAND